MKNQGFTLVELAVVIAIVGILGNVALTAFMDLRTDATGATIAHTVNQLRTASRVWALQNGRAPTGFDEFVSMDNVNPAGFTISLANIPSVDDCDVQSQTIDCSDGYNPPGGTQLVDELIISWRGGAIAFSLNLEDDDSFSFDQ